MLAIGEGASREAQEAIAQLGSSNVIIETVKPPEEETDAGKTEAVRRYGLTYADAEAIRNTIPNIQVVVPNREIEQEARYLNRRVAIRIKGTTPWHPEIERIRLIRGRFLSSIDMHHQLAICVLDDQVARKLFAFDDPLGLDVKIQGSYYRVVGIVSQTAMPVLAGGAATSIGDSGGAQGDIIYLPLTTARQ
ncbi:unnamed protein product, partial [marine sediment metagenome]